MSMLELNSDKLHAGTDLSKGRAGLAQGGTGLASSKALRPAERLGPASHKQQIPALELERTDLRAYYEMVAARALSSIKRDWRLIASIVVVTMTLACLVIPLIPRQYSATALVYPNLFSVEQAKLTPKGSIDASSLVTSEARLIVSDAILQAVVARLKLDVRPGVMGAGSWGTGITSWIRTLILPETRNHSPFDRQVALLRNRVDVAKDTRSYLISISFTAHSADEAAAVVNAIALEYIRDKKILRSQSAVALAEAELQRQLAINGERHPKVLQSIDGLETARAELTAILTAEDAVQEALAAEEGVKLAIPNRTPTSPKGFVILGLSFIVSLLIGIGLAVWRDRFGFEPQQFLLDLLATGRRYGQQIAGGSIGPTAKSGTTSIQISGSRTGWTADKWRRLRTGFSSLVQRAFAPVRHGGSLIAQRRRRQEEKPRRRPAGRSKRII